MNLQYILGGSGSGKTYKIMEAMLKRSRSISPHASMIYLVPEQFTLEAERLLCSMSSLAQQAGAQQAGAQQTGDVCGAILNPQVLSFTRLGYYVSSRTGRRVLGKTLDEAARNMIIQRLLLENAHNLEFYGGVASRQGLSHEISNIIREFAQSGLYPPEKILSYESSLDPVTNEVLRRKMRDLSKLYAMFLEYGSEYSLAEAEAALLPSRIDSSSFLENCEVWVDGFNGFTKQEYDVMSALMKKAACITVCMCIPAISASTSYAHVYPNDPLSQIKNSINNITRIAHEASVKVLPPKLLNDTPRFATPELAHLERAYLRYDIPEASSKPSNIQIHRAATKHNEVVLVADAILRLVRGGMRYTDIAVACSDPTSYEAELRSVFESYGIPLFLDTRVEASVRLTRLISCVALVAAYGWQHSHVFGFLKSGLGPLARHDVDVLENYCLAHGIDTWRWNTPFDDEYLEGLRTQIVSSLDPLLGAGHKPEYTAAIWEIIETLAPAHLLSQDEIRSLELISQMLERMSDILRDAKLSLTSLSNVLCAGLNTLELGLIPPRLEQVVVADAERSRLPRIKALFVMGANDGTLPRISNAADILTPIERAKLISMGLELSQDPRTRTFQEVFSIYTLLCQPSTFLHISYLTDEDNKPLIPSPAIDRLQSIFPSLQTNTITPRTISTPRAMLPHAGEALRAAVRTGLSTHQLELIRWYTNDPIYSPKLKRMERAAFQKTSRIRLGSTGAQNLTISASRLERYANCPFAYLIEHLLALKPRKLFAPTAGDFGSFYHLVLEQVGRELGDSPEAWASLTTETINSLVGNASATAVMKLPALSQTPRGQYILKRMSQVSKTSLWALSEHVRSGDFKPQNFELSFGSEAHHPPLVLSLPDGSTASLSGIIDRVDVMHKGDKTYLRIVDYKSGNPSFKMSDIYNGTQLQLLLYMAALLNISPNTSPGGVFYLKLDNPLLERDKSSSDRELLSKFKLDGLVVDSIARNMDNGLSGHSANIKGLYGKTDGTLSNTSSVISSEDFSKVLMETIAKATDVAYEINSGNADVRPLEQLRGNQRESACDTCQYSSICQVSIRRGYTKD